jgi:hypothetical protein
LNIAGYKKANMHLKTKKEIKKDLLAVLCATIK